MGIFEKFKKGFQKSATNLASGFKNIILKKEIDDIALDKIEDFLISSDVGVEAANEIREIISQKKILLKSYQRMVLIFLEKYFDLSYYQLYWFFLS